MLNMWDPKVTDPTGCLVYPLSHDHMEFAMQPIGTTPGATTGIMSVAG